ncbi:NrdJb [Exilibacterium tricleocarpae]|uniref:ribonucleoside-diphosphate reductase n=1 Tax=Exilibacterium tricleocarpae TaxID=2591008 RepID=A0A545U8I4_9GAMM|nr:NrdJb [Exilibacterium tricleocarpae]TQV85713.1 NrdJb [Exilibacterium tricleocarpae]
MTKVIDKKIIDCEVLKPKPDVGADNTGTEAAGAEKAEAEIIHMHEKVDRPELLLGATYKIKTPLSDHALYVTINDIVLNPGTDHELRRPFEIFINSKNMDHFQWVVALTRVISAVFRKGGDCTFLVDELKAVFDPQGGYFKTGGKFMPSLVAEIGHAIESHLRMIGLLQPEEMSAHQQAILDQKRAEYSAANGVDDDTETYPHGATLCKKCHTKAVVLLDGCMTCLSCGDSKCG